jgi:hypothetical protein
MAGGCARAVKQLAASELGPGFPASALHGVCTVVKKSAAGLPVGVRRAVVSANTHNE